MTRSRRRLKLRPLIIILIISGLIATVSYGYFVAPNQVSFNKIQYRSASISTTFNDFQITLISDLNLTDSDDVDGLNELISDINSQGSNMVLFAGDLFESAVFDETNVISILSSIKTSSGKFAV
ncbi:MAG: phosphoesterase, partial [Erysipelotrichaceae bacterium]|nr:phosphoesterase [Erysipelotrichaceae bacterium]